jgi:hypothetical protein
MREERPLILETDAKFKALNPAREPKRDAQIAAYLHRGFA